METSILKSVKKNLGLDPAYTAFDEDVITHTNSAFSTLTQLGVGPDAGFRIENDEADWADFIADDDTFNLVKTYIYLKVRQVFDPPQTGYALTAMKEQIQELEWRLNTRREETDWADPDPPEELVEP
jgi:hypothetical protein